MHKKKKVKMKKQFSEEPCILKNTPNSKLVLSLQHRSDEKCEHSEVTEKTFLQHNES